ncbi:unnamed protein product [marine sediment metagenome]|uniref:Uncharacterized protein n=1 Tax=marine sediment metagenome TaxID=412755 RepID=X1TY14_9ZZZZ
MTITIDEAIENRERYLKNSAIPKSTEDYNATLLSIEALKGITAIRCGAISNVNEPLPSETED